ncbi:MAG: hypothetical protein K6U12_04455 [Armatimonadetes bacterium]|nr:hypothetical protein [Armatimonadota bacterium]CUU35519.1 hypothetical protein DCOP10_114266 [Armatimonadetes bacterium DC]
MKFYRLHSPRSGYEMTILARSFEEAVEVFAELAGSGECELLGVEPLQFNPSLYIGVAEGRAFVGRFVPVGRGEYWLKPALNWQELEAEARACVEAQGGTLTEAGLYRCPPELAQRARFGQESGE